MFRSTLGALAVLLSSAVAACQSQIPHGEGQVALQPNVQLAFQRHLDRPHPRVFFVTADGAAAYGLYCPHPECEPDPLYIRAQRRCEDRTGRPCRVFAEYGRITWRGPVAHAAPGAGAVAGIAVEWGNSRTLYHLKIDGLASGPGTVSGKIRDAACAGAVDVRAREWSVDCGVAPPGAQANDAIRARGTLSGAGPGRWEGVGWSQDRESVRVFVAANVALGPTTVAAEGPAFPALPPTYEEPAPPAIRGGNDRVSFFRLR
ncbi:MAG: hypothetical protein FJ311_12370 [Rhodospirillales bacterium]|nr:hypothetical protein [Rhodospirillales bacterium]